MGSLALMITLVHVLLVSQRLQCMASMVSNGAQCDCSLLRYFFPLLLFASGFLPCFGPSYINVYGSPQTDFSLFPDEYDDMNKGKVRRINSINNNLIMCAFQC